MFTFFAENCYFLTGPTASGKTALALEFAERESAEILSMDSVAVYREMDIGSAKPTKAERGRVVHHLIDLVNPDEEFSVVEYLRHAEAAARDCLARGKKPLFVGGSPLYLKALIFGLFEGPEGNEEFRKCMRQQAKSAEENGDPLFLHRKLQSVDPVTAARLHPNDAKRIIRALEVFEFTGKPIHEFQTQFQPEVPPQFKEKIRIIDLPRPDLHVRIEARVEQMFRDGFLEEVRHLRGKYGNLSKTAAMAVGYREVLAWLEAQEKNLPVPSEEALITEIKTHTRQMAKRQVTWFRSLLRENFMF